MTEPIPMLLDDLDLLAPIRAVENIDPDKRPAAVAEVVQSMAENGMNAATAAALRDYLKRAKLLPVSLFDEIRRDVRRSRVLRSAASPLATPEPTPAHLQIWPSWASDQGILAKLICDLRSKCALTGEQRNAKLTYLALQSRRMRKPVSLVVKGQSASGKSYTVQCVLLAVPSSAVIMRTGLSELALVYSQESFVHRTIVIFEAVALKESREKNEGHQGAMILRTLMSEGVIRHETTIKNEMGEFETKVYEKEGPTNCIVTTTADSLHSENETRMLTLATDDSKDQTARIMEAAAKSEDLAEEPDFSEWHQFDAMLDEGTHDVTVPFRLWLARNIPPAAVRLRRDFPMLLTLIRVHAMIHQLQRDKDDRGWVIATKADYVAVRELVTDLISDQVGKTVSKVMRQTVEAVGLLDSGEGVTITAVASRLDLEQSTAYRRVRAAQTRGHLVNVEPDSGRGKKAARYQKGAPLPDDVVMLPDLPPDEVWSACTFKEPAEYFADDEAAGQQAEDAKSANVHNQAREEREVSQGASSADLPQIHQPPQLALLQDQLGAELIHGDSIIHAENCPGRHPAA